MDFHHDDLDFLENLRKKVMGLGRVWTFVHINKDKAVKLEVKNEFDSELSDTRKKEISAFVKKFCKDKKIAYKTLLKQVNDVQGTQRQ